MKIYNANEITINKLSENFLEVITPKSAVTFPVNRNVSVSWDHDGGHEKIQRPEHDRVLIMYGHSNLCFEDRMKYMCFNIYLKVGDGKIVYNELRKYIPTPPLG